MRLMNHLIMLTLFVAGQAFGAPPTPDSDDRDHDCGSMPVGFHEFGIFGASRFYISHYAAFSSIHAYQVIAEVRLVGSDHDAAQRLRDDMTAHPGTHYTISPYRNVPVSPTRSNDQDDWVLPKKVAVGQTFNADIHYTANGKPVTVDSNVRIEIVDVVIKQQLDPTTPQPQTLHYVVFGETGPGETAYMAHELAAPPNPGEQKADFDQIVAVHTDSRIAQGSLLTIVGRANNAAQALKKGDAVVAAAADGQSVHAAVDAEILAISVPTER